MKFVIDHSFGILMLVMLFGVAQLWWRRVEERRRLLVITLPMLCLTILSLPMVSYLAIKSLEWPYPPRTRRPEGVQAIIVLGGSVLPADSIRLKPELGRSSLARCEFALEVYRQGPPCPLILCGGTVDAEQKSSPVAELMRNYFLKHGIPESMITVEDRSRTTAENAALGARLIHEQGIDKAVLISDAFHMHRSVSVFQRQGVSVVPWACNHRATSFKMSMDELLPSPKAAGISLEVVHEWAGHAWYTLQGQTSWRSLLYLDIVNYP